ncbi:unnamed protein product [Soboliphyme baturini]|uniref:FLYWCH-type domain-containing protein n=1 Tax=Soboliphyme baturini TaxID=241478 RepID=A0A183IYR2_9BILA|nr:unnamed protein product [Soboliphyme baturini]
MTVFKKKPKIDHHGHHVIMREGDTCSSATTESEGSEFLSKRAKLVCTFRGTLSKIFQSYKYQVRDK